MTPSRGPLAPSGAAPTAQPTRRWLVLVLVSFAVGTTRGFFYAPGAGVGLKRATRQRSFYSSSRQRRSATTPFLQPFALREPAARGGVCRMADDDGAGAAAPEGGAPQKEDEEQDVKPAAEEAKPVEVEEDKPAATEEKAVVEGEKAAEVEEEKNGEADVEEKAVEVEEDKPVEPAATQTVAEEGASAEVEEEQPAEVEAEEKTVEAEEAKPAVPEEESPVAEEEPSVAEEEKPVAEEEAPVAEKETPVAEEETPVAEEEAPVVAEPAAEKEETPVAEEEATVAEEETPVAEEEATVAEEETPVAEEKAPVAEEETPVVAEPAAEKEETAAEEEKDVVAEAVEEAPVVEEEKTAVPEVEEEKAVVAEEESAVVEEEKAEVAEEKTVVPEESAEVEEETAEVEEENPVVAEEEETAVVEEDKTPEVEEEAPKVAEEEATAEVAEESPLAAEEEKAAEPEDETEPEPEAAAAAQEEASEEESKPEMPELLNPTRKELESAFPNPPRAPYPTLPDPRRMTAKQLEAAASQDVSYGGQPAARRANIDFERSERERIHFETATRVMNYEIQAQRSEAAAAAEVDEELSPEEARKLRRAALRDDFYGLIEVTDEDEGIRADYKWDQKPELITFSGFGVLFNWHLPVGLIMREALGRAHNYVHRMPPPGAFERHFKNSHEEASFHIPCFGAKENISTWEWWFHVFTDAYLKTINEFYMDEDIVLTKIDDIVDELYYEIMVGPEAFEVMPLVKVVLDRLAAWRDNDGGPKLAVVADDDDRLHVVLENLGLLPYFDFVLTSRETGCELKETKMYEMAMETAGVKQPLKALHVGSKYATDITGSCEAGMEAVCVKRMQSLYERPNEPYEFHRVYEIGELLNRLGLPEAEEEYMGRRRGNYWEEMEDEDDEEFLDEFYSAEDDAGMPLFEG